MLNLLCILLFTITPFSLKSMEITTKRFSNSHESKTTDLTFKKVSSTPRRETPIKKSSSFRRKSTEIEKPIINNVQPEHPFITVTRSAIESQDYTTVQFHLSNPHLDPNIQGQCGYPALHIFAQAKASKGIELLLRDYRTDFSRRNIDQKLVIHYINKNNIERKILDEIFPRFTFDMVTREQCEKMISFYINAVITNEHITALAQRIKSKIQEDAINQAKNEDRKIPKSAHFPEYANDEFMIKKIWFTLSCMLNSKNT